MTDIDLERLRDAPVTSLAKFQSADVDALMWFSQQGWHLVHVEFGGYCTVRRDISLPLLNADFEPIREPAPPRFPVELLS